MTKTPYSFQLEAVELAKLHNCYISFDPGLGKTITAIECVKAFRAESGLPQRVLVVISPKIAMLQWKREIRAQDPGVAVTLLAEMVDLATLPTLVGRDTDFYAVTHYDFVRRFWKEMRILWDVIVADEAHKMKDKDTKWTIAVKKLDHKMGLRKIAMSGTPMEKSPGDLWSVLNWLEPRKYTSYWAFFDKYVASVPGFVGRKAVGNKPETLSELGDELRPRMIRRSKAEAMPDMPPLIETVVPLFLEVNQRKAYLKVREAKDLVIKFSDVSTMNEIIVAHELTRIIRMQQIASDPAELAITGPGVKQLWVRNYVADNPDEQILVFSRFRNVAVRFAMDLDAACIVGGKKPHKLEEFLDGKVQVLCGTIGAMGTALDMPMARTIIFVDTVWSSIEMTQAMQRTHRAGITEAKHVLYLEAVGTVDKLIRYAVKYKWTEAELVYKFLNTPLEQPQEVHLTHDDYPTEQWLAHLPAVEYEASDITEGDTIV